MSLKAGQKEKALQQIAEIIKKHKLTKADVAETFKRITPEDSSISHLNQYLSYIGGIFLLIGLLFVIQLYWNSFSDFWKVSIPLSAGLSLYCLGIHFSESESKHQGAPIAFLLSALFTPWALFQSVVAFFEAQGNFHHPLMLIVGTMAVQMALTFKVYRHGVSLWLFILFWTMFLTLIFDDWQISFKLTGIIAGGSLILLVYRLNEMFHVRGLGFWMVLSALSFMGGWFGVFEGTQLEIAYLVIPSFLIYLSTQIRSKALLYAGTLSLMGFISYYTSKYFSGSLGWGLVLIFLGVLFIGLGSLVLKLQQRFLLK